MLFLMVFDTVIQRNRIEFHEGSGIITGAQAMGMDVTENTLRANGMSPGFLMVFV